MRGLFCRIAVSVIGVMVLGPVWAHAQITTGTITGSVKDQQGAVIPGATIVLISESRGTKSAPVMTNESGDYVFPNVTPDTYTIEVTLESFKTARRTGIAVSGGDRVGVTPLVLDPGAIVEVVAVTAEAPPLQTQSGERSFAVTTQQIEHLPIQRQNFTSLLAFTPGVVAQTQNGPNITNASAGATRLGGAGQNNIMMDGISAMDTGNNGQMLALNVESIGEVKILTQGYQAEFGRSSGLQITAVTKSGTNQFRGAAYSAFTDSDWNATSWVREKNGDPTPKTSQKTYGYSFGGPIGKPGGTNNLFFFYAHEFRPTTTAINNGNIIRLRVPTALERVGNFSQSLDNNGNPIPALFDFTTGQPFPNNTIPADRRYGPGLAVLNRYPLPNVAQGPGMNYNYEEQPGTTDGIIQQPAVRVDYQISSKLRVNGKYSGQRRSPFVQPGLIAGFSDVLSPYPYITNYGVTVNYTVNSTTFVEATYGLIRNELTGGNEGGVLVNDSANRLAGLQDFPLLYPNAGVVDERYYAFEVMQDVNPAFWDGTSLNLPPIFGWGSRIGTQIPPDGPAPPNQRYPGWLNINRTQDFAISLTKVMGQHTFKAGFYNNHSFKAQNTGQGGVANLSFQGYVNFGNDTNNTLDSGFGYANAALGVFTQYLQASRFIEGSMLYNNTEFYAQDNWRVNNRLTLDYGIRFTRQQPQYDQFQQMSNFFADQWRLSDAPVLYVAGCSNGAVVCSGNLRNAMDPRTGQILTAPGAANTQAAIGTPIPGTGNPLNGIRQAGDGISKTGYVWPRLVVGPRFGFAFDVTGREDLIIRGGGGLFYDRPDGNTVFSIPGNPPIATSQDLRNGQLQTLGQGLSPGPVPAMTTFQYDAEVPASWQWQASMQKTLPWEMVADVSYVGNRGINRLGNFQGGATVNQNAVDFGAAFRPENQDPTLGTSSVPGATAYSTNLLRPYRGLSNINQNTTEFRDLYHSLQVSVNRRYRNGFAFGANYTWGFFFEGNTGLQQRLQHAPDGTITVRDDQGEYEDLLSNLDARPHIFKLNAIWDIPGVSERGGGLLRAITSDWQIAGVLTAGSGQAYDLAYTYQNNGANVNITGSPDYGGRVVYLADAGSGCSSNQYAQFDAGVVRGPTFGSVGMESGRNILRGCADKRVDLSVTREIRVGGHRRLTLRADVFNALNTVIITGRNNTVTFDNPTSMRVMNSQFNDNGSLNQNRLKPRDAGFGAANNAADMRNIQLQVRFSF